MLRAVRRLGQDSVETKREESLLMLCRDLRRRLYATEAGKLPPMLRHPQYLSIQAWCSRPSTVGRCFGSQTKASVTNF